MAEVLAVCISEKKGTQKHTVPEVSVKKQLGIEGDAHAGDWHRQISLLGEESVDKVRHLLPEIPPGAFAEKHSDARHCSCISCLWVRACAWAARCWRLRRSARSAHAECAIRRRRATASCPARASSPWWWRRASSAPATASRLWRNPLSGYKSWAVQDAFRILNSPFSVFIRSVRLSQRPPGVKVQPLVAVGWDLSQAPDGHAGDAEES